MKTSYERIDDPEQVLNHIATVAPRPHPPAADDLEIASRHSRWERRGRRYAITGVVLAVLAVAAGGAIYLTAYDFEHPSRDRAGHVTGQRWVDPATLRTGDCTQINGIEHEDQVLVTPCAGGMTHK